MGYSPEVIRAAKDELERRRQSALEESAALRERMIMLRPRIREIEQEMAHSSLLVARAVLEGENVDEQVRAIRERNLGLQAELAAELAAGGSRAVNFEPRHTCPACADTGYTHGRICRCYETLLKEEACRRISYAGMSPIKESGFDGLRLEYYPENAGGEVSPRRRMQDIISFCRQYAEDFSPQSPSLLLYGRTGTGKTHVSLAIARAAAEHGFGVIYSPAQMVLGRLEREYFKREEGNTLEMLTSCDLLILDDLGAEFTGPFYNSCLYNIINTRMLEGRASIISTNLDQGGLYERYGEQITSRIIGTYLPLAFLGRDIRQIRLQQSM